VFTAGQREITVKTTSVYTSIKPEYCGGDSNQIVLLARNMDVYRKSVCLYIYTKKEPKLKLVRMFGHVAENRSVWVEFTKINSKDWNVDTHLMV